MLDPAGSYGPYSVLWLTRSMDPAGPYDPYSASWPAILVDPAGSYDPYSVLWLTGAWILQDPMVLLAPLG